MSQITFFGNKFTVQQFNEQFDKWQEEYHLVLKRHELTPVSCKEESLNAMLRWYSNWISSMFAYKGNHFVTKDVLKCKGKFVAPKHYNLSDAMSKGLMGYKSPNWKQMIVVTRTASFKGKSFEDLSSMVYIQMCWYLRSVILNHQADIDCLEPEELDAHSNNSYFDMGNFFSFIRRSKYYKIVGFFADKKKELELESSYDVMLGEDGGSSILDLIADESTAKIESEPSTILNFYKRVFNLVWKEKVWSAKSTRNRKLLSWAEHPQSKFAWTNYFKEYALKFGEETPIEFNVGFLESHIIQTNSEYWDSVSPNMYSKIFNHILDAIRSLSKEGLLQVYRGAESISKPSKAQGIGSKQSYAERATGKSKTHQTVQVERKVTQLSENFGKIEILHRTVIKTVTVEGKLYTIEEDENGKLSYKVNLDLEGLSYLGHTKTPTGYSVELGTIEREYITLAEYRSRYPKKKEAKKEVAPPKEATIYPYCELPVVYNRVLECKPVVKPECIGTNKLELSSTPIQVKVRKDDLVLTESICRTNPVSNSKEYLYKGDWISLKSEADDAFWHNLVPYWYEYQKDFSLNIPNVVSTEWDDDTDTFYVYVKPLTSILHGFKYSYQNRLNDEGTAMFSQPLEKVSHNSDEKHNLYNGSWKDNPEGKFVKVFEEAPRIYDDIEWGLLSVLTKLESDYKAKYAKKSKAKK
jgi:hypothetical protein